MSTPRDRLDRLVLLDVGRGMLARAGRKAVAAGWQLELRQASAERLGFPDGPESRTSSRSTTWSPAHAGRRLTELGRSQQVIMVEPPAEGGTAIRQQAAREAARMVEDIAAMRYYCQTVYVNAS